MAAGNDSRGGQVGSPVPSAAHDDVRITSPRDAAGANGQAIDIPKGGLHNSSEGLHHSDVKVVDSSANRPLDPARGENNEIKLPAPSAGPAQRDHQPPATKSNSDFQSQAAQPEKLNTVEPKRFGQPYSEHNPLPNIQTHRELQKQHQEESRRFFNDHNEDSSKPPVQDASQKDDSTGHESPAPGDQAVAGATDDVPIGAEKTNVLFQPTPDVNFSSAFRTLSNDALRVAYVVAGSVVCLDWLFIGGGSNGFFKSLPPALGMAALVFLMLTVTGRSIASRKAQKSEARTEKLRYVPESVEWMNSLIETLWHTLQQDFFDNIASQANDTIAPFIPKGVPATVKIVELGHGCFPARVLSMRSLPDSEFGDLVPTHGNDKGETVEEVRKREEAAEREEGGVFYNLEIAIAYHMAPFRPRKDQMHVDILAKIGPVPLPVFVQVKEFMATIRIRLQMHPDLPFLKNLTFALTETPKINVCVSVGAPWALDLLNLPIIDSVLISQTNSAAAAFVQPKSMSLDMTAYIGGSDQKEETQVIGVLFVKVHRARNLARQDSRGPGADPYLTIAFSKYEKPMYASRIIKGDRNPVWEESAIIMVKAEHVKRAENVLLRLWDSDTTGSDDVSGVCEFPLQELVLKANEMQKREDKLQGDVANTDAEGVLEWEIGYFPRAGFQKSLRTGAADPRDHHGETKEVADEDKTQNAHNTVPDPNLPSGILEFTIHQCINIKVKNDSKKSMGQVEVQRQDSDGEDDDSDAVSIDYIPSLYVTADINDELVYRTRVKSINDAPTFNSTAESYIRDWRLATLTVSVWDTRKKSRHDCLVGVVSLKLSDIFQNSSSVVKFYHLSGGEGTGGIRVSMIFRSTRMKLEKSLLGFSVGSFVFTSPIVCTGDSYTSKLRLRTSGSKRAINSTGSKSNNGHTWTLESPQNSLPVHFRYLSPVVLEFVQGAGVTERINGPIGKNKHYAVLWLFELVDNEDQTFTLPIYKTNNPNRLTQNVVRESDAHMTLEKVGEVRFSGKFKAGIDESHGDFLNNDDQWGTYQSWLAARRSGQREHQANRETNETVDRLARGIEKTQSIHV